MRLPTLKLQSAQNKREQAQIAEIYRLKGKVKMLTAEKMYRYFLDTLPSQSEKERLRALFAADDHSAWYLPPDKQSVLNKGPLVS